MLQKAKEASQKSEAEPDPTSLRQGLVPNVLGGSAEFTEYTVYLTPV